MSARTVHRATKFFLKHKHYKFKVVNGTVCARAMITDILHPLGNLRHMHRNQVQRFNKILHDKPRS